MPQRLRELSQSWADLAVRGFDKSAQAKIDKNDRERAQLQGIGNAIASGIVRKKGRDRQDKMLAEDRARDDAIRAERYGREDARNTIEDGRYQERRQAERYALALKATEGKMAQMADRVRSTAPEGQQAVLSEYAALQEQHAAIMARLTGETTQAAASPRDAIGAGYKATYGADPMDVGPMGVAPTVTPQEQTALNNGGFFPGNGVEPGAAPARPSPVAPTSPPGTASAAPPVAGAPAPVDPTFLTPSGRVAVARAKEAATLGAKYDRLDKAAAELLRRINDAKSPVGVPQMQARHRALLDEATRAREAAAEAGQSAQMYEAQGRQEVADQAKQVANQHRARQILLTARQQGVPAEMIQSWVQQGITDPDALDTLRRGALATPKAEPVTPKEKAAHQRELMDAYAEQGLDDTGKLPNIPNPGKDPALSRLAVIDKDRLFNRIPSSEPLDMSLFSEAQILSLAENDQVPQAYRDDFRAAAGAIWGRGDDETGMRQSPVTTPTAPATGAREAASAELKALPPEQQTPEAWKAIKRKHGL